MQPLPTVLQRLSLATLLGWAVATQATAQNTTPQQDAQVLAKACNRFGERLYTQLAEHDSPMCSPGSVAMVLYMLLPGADGETAKQIAKVLHLPKELRGARLLAAARLLAKAPGQRMRVTNDYWVHQSARMNPGYADLLRKHLEAPPRPIDFADLDTARRRINAHVAEATSQRIPELLLPGDLVPNTQAVLTNTMWFKASWREPFAARATRPATFTLANGKQVQVPMMSATGLYGYADTDAWTGVGLSFEGTSMRFEVVVPKVGHKLAEAEKALFGDELCRKIQADQVHLRLPRFRTGARHSLVDALQAMGMAAAFDPQSADFTGIQPTSELWIDDVVHQTWIDVDEEGCEAAAATAAILKERGVVRDPKVVTIDRAFAFALRDLRTGLVWMAGRVEDPRTQP